MNGIIYKVYILLILATLSLTVLPSYGQTPNLPTSFTATTLSDTEILLQWQAPTMGTTPNAYLITAHKFGGADTTVVDGVPLADDFNFNGTNENGNVNVTHVAGLNTYTWTSLDPETSYTFTIYSYTTSGGTPPNYRQTGAPSDNTRTFSVEPTGHAASFTASAVSFSQIDLTFSDASTVNADGYIILRKTGSDPDATGVVDGNNPGSLTLPGGTTLVTTISSNSATSYSDNGLSGSTDYHYILIPYNSGFFSSTYNYYIDPTIPATNATTLAAPPSISAVLPAGSTCAGETITINGSDFNVPTVTINGVIASIIGTPTSNQIQITAPGGAAVGTFPIVVTNADLTNDSSSPYTIKAAINLTLNVASSKSNPATSENFNIEVGGGTQSTVSYRVRRLSPTTSSYSPSQTGNGGILSFGPYVHGTAGIYVYEVQAQSTNCTSATLTQTATVTIAALAVNAGPATAVICDGDEFMLGGSPTALGGSGFYNISWTSSPPGFTSSASNPVVTPSVTTIYTVTVEDSDGNIENDAITVTVNTRTDTDDLDILFTPSSISYSIDGDPVDLSFTVVGGVPGTGVFSGTAVNGTTNKFYPNAANVGNNDIALTFTNADNCETSIVETVNVYDPNGFISGLDPLYCPYGTDNLTINIPPPYISFVDVFLVDPANQNIPVGSAWTKNLVTRQMQINLGQLPIGRSSFNLVYTISGIIGYIYVPPLPPVPIFGIVQTTVTVPLIIKAQPTVKINLKSKTTEFCRNDNPIDIAGSPIGGIWQGGGVTPAVGNDNNPAFAPGDNGNATFNPATGSIGSNLIRYIFQDAQGCRDTTETTLTVFNVPTTDFTAPNGCVGIPVAFGPSVAVPPLVNVSFYLWDFDDDQREGSILLSNPTYHTYSSSNDYDVTFTVRTTDGCEVALTKPISVGDIPDINLNWRNVCEGDPSRFGIQSNFFTNAPSDVNTITWDFGDGPGNVVVDANPFLPDTTIFHNYAATGYYTAFATIESDLGCSQSDTVQVYKVFRTGIITNENEYIEDFNGPAFEVQGWKTGGKNSSWEWGAPAGALISDDASGGGNAWATNLSGPFNASEKSWVHSPCFDLSQIERPVLSLDLRSLTFPLVQGVVLQINTTNTTNSDADWENIGSVGEGANWFDATGIISNPGNQTLNQTGWSELRDSTSWRTATIALDNSLSGLTALQKSRVRLRLAFASPADAPAGSSNPEGFAFDNFRISQRDRIILLENFTNNGANGADPNKTSNATVNNFVEDKQNEIVKLEYHLSVSGPNPDPIYYDNPADANARAAFYGITSTPFIMMDGKIANNLTGIFNNQTLRSAGATIDTIFTTDTPQEKMNIEVTFTAKNDLPPNTVLHIAVVEKTIKHVTAMGTNEEDSFRYVMKKMLPNALGTKYSTGILKDDSRTVNVSWSPTAYNLDSLAVIAFLQNENTGEIYQARLLRNPTYIPSESVITGTETALAEQIRVYPSPAHQEVSIQLPFAMGQPLSLKCIDSYGKEVYTGAIETGKKGKTIKTIDWAGGMYILLIEERNGMRARKKIMVLHE